MVICLKKSPSAFIEELVPETDAVETREEVAATAKLVPATLPTEAPAAAAVPAIGAPAAPAVKTVAATAPTAITAVPASVVPLTALLLLR